MSVFWQIVIFVVGAAVGSFINVLGLRYSEREGFKNAFRGRSKCPHCKKVLSSWELVPFVSFLIQGGRCKGCNKKISFQYPIVELLAGLVAWGAFMTTGHVALGILWTLVFWTLLLISVIDFRLKLIPNRLVAFLLGLGVINFFIVQSLDERFAGAISEGSFIGHYSLMMRFSDSLLVGYVAAVLFGVALFGGIHWLSRGKAMGMGDVKLVAALGTLVMWPDIVWALALAFITGSLSGLFLMIRKGLELKSSLPFGPFIAIGVTLVFFFGYDIINAYFNAFGLV